MNIVLKFLSILPSVHKLLKLTVTDERSATTMKPGNRKKISCNIFSELA